MPMYAFSSTAGTKKPKSAPILLPCTIRIRVLLATIPTPIPPDRMSTVTAWTIFWRNGSILAACCWQFPENSKKERPYWDVKHHISNRALRPQARFGAQPPKVALSAQMTTHWCWMQNQPPGTPLAACPCMWNDPWLLVSCHRNNFCVVKGHFCSFLVSNILVTSAFCRLTFLSIQLFFHNSYSLAQFISLKRDALISWNYFDRLNVLRSFSKFYFQKSTLGTSAFAFWFFAFDLICFRFYICLNFKRMLMF